MKTVTVTAFMIIGIYIAGTVLRERGFSIQHNVSTSVALGYYATWPSNHYRVGDLVGLYLPSNARKQYHDRPWLPDRRDLLLKHVAAEEGDHVCVTHSEVLLNGSVAAHIANIDQSGYKLYPIRECRVLVKNELFLLNVQFDNSFDSRYFGVISIDQIYGLARKI